MTHCTHAHGLASRSRHARRAFSLIEVLLAIFILGIGIISIAAIFPAGIAQQRLSNDDLMGPIVANHAVSVLRSKLRPEYFGTFEEFADIAGLPGGYISPTIPGDWGWMAPGVLQIDDPNTPRVNEIGTLDIFSHRRAVMPPPWNAAASVSPLWNGWPGPPQFPTMPNPPSLYGIPFNTHIHGVINYPPEPPQIFVTQGERYYPMQLEEWASGTSQPRFRERPQYVWDCMFRKYQGRVFVAIFVYRVNIPGLGASEYRVPRHPVQSLRNFPFIPTHIEFDPARRWNAGSGAPDTRLPTGQVGQWIIGSNNDAYDPRNWDEAWQEPRQWILDQNNNVHRVLGNRRGNAPTTNIHIELTRGVEPVLGRGNTENGFPSETPAWYVWNPGNPNYPTWVFNNVVTDIWYMPKEVMIDTTGNGINDTTVTITPVYVTVKEL